MTNNRIYILITKTNLPRDTNNKIQIIMIIKTYQINKQENTILTLIVLTTLNPNKINIIKNIKNKIIKTMNKDKAKDSMMKGPKKVSLLVTK